MINAFPRGGGRNAWLIAIRREIYAGHGDRAYYLTRGLVRMCRDVYGLPEA